MVSEVDFDMNEDEYTNYNRFQNLDGAEYKIVQKLLTLDNKYANNIWRLLKYNTVDALNKDALTQQEKMELIIGTPQNAKANESASKDEVKARVFLYPFADDAWTVEATSIYIYVNKIEPINRFQSNVDIVIETVTHADIGIVATEADTISNPEETNPNDYIYSDDVNPYVEYKSRITVLLKSLIAALNGTGIDGIGTLQFTRAARGLETNGNAEMNMYNRKSFFGHTIHFNAPMANVSDSPDRGY